MSETVFKEVRYDLGSLVKFIELGEIGLPDIQHPFIKNQNSLQPRAGKVRSIECRHTA